MLTALVLFALTQAPAKCQVDAECTLRRPCSCECCPEWKAMTKAELEAERQRCSRLGPCRPQCAGEVCEPEAKFKAVCDQGRCVRKDAEKPKKK